MAEGLSFPALSPAIDQGLRSLLERTGEGETFLPESGTSGSEEAWRELWDGGGGRPLTRLSSGARFGRVDAVMAGHRIPAQNAEND